MNIINENTCLCMKIDIRSQYKNKVHLYMVYFDKFKYKLT